MTTLEITTQPHTSTTAQAQRAAGADYDAVLACTHDGVLAADAYHLAYQRLARVPGGCGPICGCNLCRDEFGVKGSALSTGYAALHLPNTPGAG